MTLFKDIYKAILYHKFIVITSIYYIWVCAYSLIIADNIYLDATYFLIEDLFGVVLVMFLIMGIIPSTSQEVVATYGIVFYKSMAIFSEVFIFWGIFIHPNWWATFAICALFLNLTAWTIIKK